MSLLKTSTTTMALLSLPSMTTAWTTTNNNVVPPRWACRRSTTLPVAMRQSSTANAPNGSTRHQSAIILQAGGPFFGPEEEFACPEEEECEIDWDLMPGFDDQSSSKDEVEDESDIDMQPRPTFALQALESLDKGRVHLEMNWQIDECETDKDSCADFCPDCAGSGRQPCRFCRGTGFVSLGNEFKPCLVCSAHAVVGQEDCASCRGTGQIAPWAMTMDEHLKNDHREEKPQNFF